MPEKFSHYTARKMGEIEDFVIICKNHPELITNFSITDTIMKDPTGALHPVKRVTLEINEVRLKELQEKK